MDNIIFSRYENPKNVKESQNSNQGGCSIHFAGL